MNSHPPRVTLRDVAERLGVSAMTVSLALRGHPRIPVARRKEVQMAAEQMGYRPNPNAAALAQQRRHSMVHPVSASLAWINHWQEPERLRRYKEFDGYWRGAMKAAERNGFSLEEFVIGRDLSFSRLENVLKTRNIQGILIPPHGGIAQTAPNLSSMDWSRYSVIKFGYSVPNLPAHIVAGNHIQGTFLACEKIRESGYRRLGYVSFAGASILGKAGAFLFQTHLSETERIPMHFIEQNLSRKKNLCRLDGWIRKHRPDAILSEVAEMWSLLGELGYQVPRDIGLAATSLLDGNAEAGIDQNSEEIGRVAVETLTELIYHNERGLATPRREVLVDAFWQAGGTLPVKSSGKE